MLDQRLINSISFQLHLRTRLFMGLRLASYKDGSKPENESFKFKHPLEFWVEWFKNEIQTRPEKPFLKGCADKAKQKTSKDFKGLQAKFEKYFKRLTKTWKTTKDFKRLQNIAKDWQNLQKIWKDFKRLKKTSNDWKRLKQILKECIKLQNISKDRLFYENLSNKDNFTKTRKQQQQQKCY